MPIEKVPYTHEVFISYAWGGESENLVNEIEKTLQEKGINIVRDKTGGLDYRGKIKEFMRCIGEGNFVIVIISDRYLRSENCMFELLQIAANGNFYDRVYPVILEDAHIFKPVERLDYVRHWEQQLDELDQAIKTVESTNLQGIHDDINLYAEIRSTIARLLDILRDMNTLTPQMHQNSGFKELYDALTARIETADSLKQSNASITQNISYQRQQSAFEYDIFLSFSSKDYHDANILGEKLRAYGLKVFMSNDSLANEAGKPFFDQIDHALKQSAHFLMYCSANALLSGWVKHEYQAFFHQFYIPSQGKRRFILFESPEFDRATLPTLLSSIQTASEIDDLVNALVIENKDIQQGTSESKTQHIENEIWEKAKNKPEVETLQAYLDQYPNGIYVKEAQAQIDKFKKEETAWWQALEANTLNAYTDFMAVFPSGKYSVQASQKLKDLQQETAKAKKNQKAEQEESDWQKAHSSNTFHAYQTYLQQYPTGKYTALANAKLATIKKETSTIHKQVNKTVSSSTETTHKQLNKQVSSSKNQPQQKYKSGKDLPEWIAYTLLIFFTGSFLLLAFGIAKNSDTSDGFDGIYLLGPVLGLVMSFLYYFDTSNHIFISGFWLRFLVYTFLTSMPLTLLNIDEEGAGMVLLISFVPAMLIHFLRNKGKTEAPIRVMVKIVSYAMFASIFLSFFFILASID